MTGAANVTIEISPGDAVAFEPATGSTTISYPCDGHSHTYTAWPGGFRTAKKSVTVTARTAATTGS